MSHSVDETYEVYRERERKARKPHHCAACREPIPPGHRYFTIFILFDGAAETLKRCARCQAIHEHLRELSPGDMWPDERLNCGEEYEEHWGIAPPDAVAELAFLTAEEMQHRLDVLRAVGALQRWAEAVRWSYR